MINKKAIVQSFLSASNNFVYVCDSPRDNYVIVKDKVSERQFALYVEVPVWFINALKDKNIENKRTQLNSRDDGLFLLPVIIDKATVEEAEDIDNFWMIVEKNWCEIEVSSHYLIDNLSGIIDQLQKEIFFCNVDYQNSISHGLRATKRWLDNIFVKNLVFSWFRFGVSPYKFLQMRNKLIKFSAQFQFSLVCHGRLTKDLFCESSCGLPTLTLLDYAFRPLGAVYDKLYLLSDIMLTSSCQDTFVLAQIELETTIKGMKIWNAYLFIKILVFFIILEQIEKEDVYQHSTDTLLADVKLEYIETFVSNLVSEMK